MKKQDYLFEFNNTKTKLALITYLLIAISAYLTFNSVINILRTNWAFSSF
jgi:hypothetical protein